jgi:hypothetical protein
MLGCGTAIFTDPEDFRVNVPGASINLVLTDRCDFKTRLTWVNVRSLRVVRCEESAARIAFVVLEPDWVFVSFPTGHNPPPIWNGSEMRPGEIVWHGRGDHIHQRTSGPGRWALMSVASRDLADFSQALIHTKLTPSPAEKILKPPSKLVAELLRLHAQACRLAETKPDMIAHREVARAMEHDLVYALVNCLTADEAHHDVNVRQRHAEIPQKTVGSVRHLIRVGSLPFTTLPWIPTRNTTWSLTVQRPHAQRPHHREDMPEWITPGPWRSWRR